MWVILLLVAWASAFLTCGRLCLAAAAAGQPPEPARSGTRPETLTLYEAAFLAGGPHRVTDVALVTMGREHRLLLAHTGWATVVDPVGHDELECSVITAIGPGGQSPVPEVRAAHEAADAVRTLDDRLTAAGLAVPAPARTDMATAVRLVRAACGLILATAAVAVPMAPPGTGQGQAAAWFSLPLLLTSACLAIARIEIHPYTSWASPAGQELLGRLSTGLPGRGRRGSTGDADDKDGTGMLTALAIRGRKALADPELRAALAATLRDHRY
ncbi:TIGR04222 domain-containing membrane protein [Streptomyces sp. UNOC14_S4]|uniref:TIGR04222 domain-containing membrane protein n=1 Tax=Streptomyces sp. UNOC14_S4 TaxID=2872340 RepID=UPI001E568AE4|nr:TIGR04222 domain-containing membrane protein [Streptomyces sp. UNOC14_S4]MCC3770427.1 TIGR04222 domain-containing membrane protein [Streptomyces sp. UNOC14_S4]